MKNNNTDDQQPNSELKQRLDQLQSELNKKQAEQRRLTETLANREREFHALKNSKLWRLLNPKTIKKTIRTMGAYVLGRRNPKRLYSSAYKRKQAQNDLKPYKYHLYDLGFTERALSDLENLFETTTNHYLLRASAWELALWYANDYSAAGAYHALGYLEIAKHGEKDGDQLRRIAIIEAEMYDLLGEQTVGKEVIEVALQREIHPDLYFALANLEATLEGRLDYFNRVMALYDLAPITFKDGGTTYDDLQTTRIDRTVTNGPKVSVILPAYNAEVGIQTAIDSILTQTWRNLELLIVDDCSPDNTRAVIKKYAEQDERIKVFSTPENSGPYVARNIALKEATGEFVTVNDADDWSHAEKLERQVTHLIENPSIIANTSGHARLTEELKAYRRGTPGKYIFPNMSSLMFRREPVMEKLGFWDSVRFAADGEFKRRLLRAFGKESIIDVETGPLSLPRQSVTSLTASSAFGYNGFFMGARKEYVEAFSAYHESADNLYYPYPQEKRLFPVPEPMWPQREDKCSGRREFDIVIVADFSRKNDAYYQTIREMIVIHNQIGLTTGLVHMATYGTHHRQKIHASIRKLIDGENVQVLVYGEQIKCDMIFLQDPVILQYKQAYIPNILAQVAAILICEKPKQNHLLRDASRQLIDIYKLRGIWYPINETIRQNLLEANKRDLRFITLANDNWLDSDKFNEETYIKRLKHWLVDEMNN
ncbi:MAG TPA: glycosyltransferase family 2 protein [Cerasibacillus sp.]|uniref:glycosyltransferase family 2 protein n=1 Tax=Cerasibacillus sp. TaxID=2498711 RepID=UPI002F3F832B